MLKNWFKIYIYHAVKNKAFTLLTILGLAIGIAGVIFSTLYWKDENSYDQWNPYKNRVFEVMTEFTHNNSVWNSTVVPLAENLEKKSNSIESMSWINSLYYKDVVFINNEKLYIEKIIATDQNFFDCIPFQFVNGSVNNFKKNQFAVAIEENEAKKIFGQTNPINQFVTLLNGKKMPILGVYKLEKYSTIKPKYIFSTIYNRLKNNKEEWGNFGTTLLVKLKDPTNKNEVEKLGTDLFYQNKTLKGAKEEGIPVDEYTKTNGVINVKLQSIGNARHGEYNTALPEGSSNKLFLKINLGLSILILCLSIINYINLSTAQAIRRAKEVGIRKVLGASKKNIIVQFILETSLTTIIAIIVALTLVEIGLPYYNLLINKEIEVDFLSFSPYLISIFIIVLLLAGIFPALYVANFKVLKVLKGVFSRSKNGIWLRNTMLILQFSIAAFFIAGGILVTQQVSYMANKNLGYNGDQIVSVKFKRTDLGEKKFEFLKSFQQDFLKINGVKDVNAIAFNFGENGSTSSSGFTVNKVNLQGENMSIDFGFFDMMDIKMDKGRDFNPNISSDTISNVILNQTAYKMLENDLKINDEFNWNNQKFKLIGVVKDFNLGSPKNKINPMIFFNFNTVKRMSSNLQNFLFKIEPENANETIAAIESFWKKNIDKDYPFEYEFVNQQYARSYELYTKQEKMFKILNVIVIIIALFGLFALSSYTIERKYKEIAIRKVLGAETSSLLKILSKQYIYLAIIGFFIAVFPSYFLMQNWLENFAYRIDISPWIYVFAFVLLLSLTLIVVLLKAFFAIKINILKYIKYE